MKILYVNVNYRYSSTGRIVYELSRASIERGHEVLTAFGRGNKVADKKAIKFSYDIETIIHAGLTRILGLTSYFSPFSTYRLINIIKKFKPTIIHLHNLDGYYVNIGQLIKYLKTTKVVIVWTLHSEFLYTGKCANSKSCIKFESGCYDCPLLRDYPKTYLFDFTRLMYNHKKKWFESFNQLKALVSPSNWLHERVMRSMLRNYEIDVIHNGIDTSNFYYLDSNQEDLFQVASDKVLVLSVIGNLDDPNKGYQRLIELSKLTQNSSLVFIVIGDSIIRKKNTHNLLHFDKINDSKKLNQFYNSSDYFLILSEYETYPTVCLEASSTGTPVIGFDVGGVREACIGIEKYLFPFGSIQILEFLNNLRTKNHVKILNVSNEILDNRRMSNRYLELYEKVSVDYDN
jgi:putative colanic acid biosynthesis glycosyltransferase